MNQVPSIWRTELWHPMLVHFPVATLLLATIAGLMLMFAKTGSVKLFLTNVTQLMLCIGVATGWIGIYTGLLSYNIEVRKLCDPEVLQYHQWWGYAAMFVYSAALLSWIISKWWIKPKPLLFSWIMAVLLVAGAGCLTYCGHLGASVVYQQGGGTYKPSANCAEFER